MDCVAAVTSMADSWRDASKHLADFADAVKWLVYDQACPDVERVQGPVVGLSDLCLDIFLSAGPVVPLGLDLRLYARPRWVSSKDMYPVFASVGQSACSLDLYSMSGELHDPPENDRAQSK